ncbi:MAG: hypothetical protein ACOC4C_02475 [Fibrobacterota bacterium]
MYRSWHRVVAAILLICFPVAVFAQTGFFGTEDDEPTMVAQQESMFGEEQEAVNESSGGSENPIQNAILEGIQLSSEPGEREDEVIISGYFIFRDKPTSYFYETNLKEKKMVFEFNDTEMGSSPIPSAKQPPIKGFRIEQTEVNVNEDIQGLKPEWHDVVKVSFFMDAIPHITVKDEYSIVSFSFKWSTDPEKLEDYVQESQTGKVVLFSVLGLGAVGGGLLAYFLTNQPPPPEEEKPLGIGDLPVHPESHR